jgi:hypothetical protein
MSNYFPDTPQVVDPLTQLAGQVLKSDSLTTTAQAQNWGMGVIGFSTQFAQWYRKGVVIGNEGPHGPFTIGEFVVPAVTSKSEHPYIVSIHGFTSAGASRDGVVTFETLDEAGTIQDSVSITFNSTDPIQPFTTLDVVYFNPTGTDLRIGRIRVVAGTTMTGTPTFSMCILGLSATPESFLADEEITNVYRAPPYDTGISVFDPEQSPIFEPLSTDGGVGLTLPAGESAPTLIPWIMLNNIEYLNRVPKVLFNKMGIPKNEDSDDWWDGTTAEDQFFRLGLNRGWQGASFPVWEGLGVLPQGDFKRKYFVAAKIARYSTLEEVAGFNVADGKCRIGLGGFDIRDDKRRRIFSQILELTPPIPVGTPALENPTPEWRYGSFESYNYSASIVDGDLQVPFQQIGTIVVGPGYKNVGFEPYDVDAHPVSDCYIESIVIWGI